MLNFHRGKKTQFTVGTTDVVVVLCKMVVFMQVKTMKNAVNLCLQHIGKKSHFSILNSLATTLRMQRMGQMISNFSFAK